MSMLTNVADYLEAQTLLVAGSYFLSELPDKPDDIVVLYETPGLPPGFVHDKSNAAYEYPRLQIISRSADYQTAYQKAHDLFKALSQVVNATLGGVWYMRINPMQAPYQIQRDGNDRSLIVCNYQVSKESVNA